MEKINVAELLKDCPKGMELDCTMLDKIILNGVDNSNDPIFPIRVRRKDGCLILLTKYGQYFDDDYAKCVIFPKGKTTWKDFHRPFVEGDIVSTESGIYIGIVKSTEDSHRCHTFCSTNDKGEFIENIDFLFSRFATEEEKQKLFKAIKDNGYTWNAETKTLEKLPKFKVGDKVKHKCDKNNTVITITGSKQDYYYIQYYNIIKNDYQTEKISFTDQDKYELIIDKFE